MVYRLLGKVTATIRTLDICEYVAEFPNVNWEKVGENSSSVPPSHPNAPSKQCQRCVTHLECGKKHMI